LHWNYNGRLTFFGASSTAPLSTQVELRRENDATLHAKTATGSEAMDFCAFKQQESTSLLLVALAIVLSE
jgi:hypothetical protein